MAMQKVQIGAIVAVAATLTVVSVLAASLLMAYQTIPNQGIVKTVGVGVFSDVACTKNVTSIYWGTVEPGATVNYPVYIKNLGTARVMLNMTTENWSQGASGYMTFIWNREGEIINPGSAIPAVLTLSISSNISGVTNFSFDIKITGTEYKTA